MIENQNTHKKYNAARTLYTMHENRSDPLKELLKKMKHNSAVHKNFMMRNSAARTLTALRH
jgi:hypothetical protein